MGVFCVLQAITRRAMAKTSIGSRSCSDAKAGELQSLATLLRGKWKHVLLLPIYKVPQQVMASQRASYSPQTAGFGFHHHQEMCSEWSEMDEIKVKSLCSVAKRIRVENVNNIVTEIWQFRKAIRRCYGNSKHNYSNENLALNMTMDACFILEFFKCLSEDSVIFFLESTPNLKFDKEKGWKPNSNSNRKMEIIRDIFKLENQIPLFVLLRILQLEFQTLPAAISKLAEMLCLQPQFKILPFFLKPRERKEMQHELEENINGGAYHLLHLLSKHIEKFLSPSTMSVNEDITNICKAVEISQEFGIKLKPSTNGHVRFEKRWLTSSILYLPQIHLDEDTEPLLRNLIAFALQCEEEMVILNFMWFMNCLISSDSECVALLRKEQIIISRMECNKELADKFDHLCKEIPQKCGPFENVWRQLEEHKSCRIVLSITQSKFFSGDSSCGNLNRESFPWEWCDLLTMHRKKPPVKNRNPIIVKMKPTKKLISYFTLYNIRTILIGLVVLGASSLHVALKHD